LADKLHKINPSWSDEKIYQETRRIVGAVIQVITYEHFLPIILGKNISVFFNYLVKITVRKYILSCCLSEKIITVEFPEDKSKELSVTISVDKRLI